MCHVRAIKVPRFIIIMLNRCLEWQRYENNISTDEGRQKVSPWKKRTSSEKNWKESGHRSLGVAGHVVHPPEGERRREKIFMIFILLKNQQNEETKCPSSAFLFSLEKNMLGHEGITWFSSKAVRRKDKWLRSAWALSEFIAWCESWSRRFLYLFTPWFEIGL